MPQEPELTEDQARELITRLIGTTKIVLRPFEFGWAAKRVLSEEEHNKGMHVGLGSYLIDRTGVVTVHSSLPLSLVVERYCQDRRLGRITGRQVWPPIEDTPQTWPPTEQPPT